MGTPVGQGRERLLEKLFDEFGETGPSPDMSMRQVAERLGVHHTLLTYHFGSRPRLLAAVLAEARRRDNVVITSTDDELGFAALTRALWEFYSNDAHGDRTRAFFHVAGLALYDPDAYQDFIANLDDLRRILEAAATRDGRPKAEARQQSIMAIAFLRGFLLQRLLNPAAEVDAAAEAFLLSLSSAPTGS